MEIDPEPVGTTRLEPEELEQLKPTHIATRGELNEWEQANIADAAEWATARRGRRPPLLSDRFLKLLHRRMFDRTWKWAGGYRTTEKNIGIAPSRIAEQVRVLCQDTQYQVDHHTYDPDEIALRFHHRLVMIHPFPNGNGRHARLMTDLLLRSWGREPFTWGGRDLQAVGSARQRYLEALRAADAGNYQLLREFVRS